MLRDGRLKDMAADSRSGSSPSGVVGERPKGNVLPPTATATPPTHGDAISLRQEGDGAPRGTGGRDPDATSDESILRGLEKELIPDDSTEGERKFLKEICTMIEDDIPPGQASPEATLTNDMPGSWKVHSQRQNGGAQTVKILLRVQLRGRCLCSVLTCVTWAY